MNDALRLDELVAHTELGEEARTFVKSQLGECLIGMAKQEVDAALLSLGEVDPTDVHKIRELQMQAKFGRSFEQWLAELITRGDEALQEYRNHESQSR
jgi:hypothetical protein